MTKFQITVFSELHGETECCIQDMDHALNGGFNPCADGTDYKLTLHEIEQLKDGFDNFIPSSKLETPLNLIALMLPEEKSIKIPQHFRLDKKQYADVKNCMQKAGGTYSKNAFNFEEPGIDVYLRILNGEKYNLKKEFQFFATPDDLADYLVELAEVEAGQEILEPSAGRGSIVKAVHRELYDAHTVWAFELMPTNMPYLEQIIGCRILGKDFLTECDTHFDRIIANPPFAKNQDIDHIYKMYDSLKDGGRLVSIASKHWQLADNKKVKIFRDFLDDTEAKIYPIPAGRFKESGTMVETCVIVINKV